MPRSVAAPAVELTLRVRYPLPDLVEDYSEFGIHSVEDLVREQIETFRLDPADLVDLIDSDRSDVEITFEIDAPDDPFGGGEWEDPDHGPLRGTITMAGNHYGGTPQGVLASYAPAEYHGLGDE